MAQNSFQVDKVHNATSEEILGYCEEYRHRDGNPDFRVSVTGGDQGYVYVNQIKSIIVLRRRKTYSED